jgi:uncharacterized membrane protein YebE (DUF533 family)
MSGPRVGEEDDLERRHWLWLVRLKQAGPPRHNPGRSEAPSPALPLGKAGAPHHNRPGMKEGNVAEQPDSLRADLILKAMIAVAAADGGLDDKEVHLIQQVYQDHAGKPISAEEIAGAAEATPRDVLLAELSAAAPALDRSTKEEIVRSAYLTLLADDRIAGEERKRLQDIAAALKIQEIHFGAILEDLAIWLSGQGKSPER